MIRLTLLSSLAIALLASPLDAQEEAEAVETVPNAAAALIPAAPVADSTFDRYLLRMPPEDPRLLVDRDIGRSAAQGALAGGLLGLFVGGAACGGDPPPGITSGMCAGGGALLGAVVGGLLGALWAALPRYERPGDPPAVTAPAVPPSAGS